MSRRRNRRQFLEDSMFAAAAAAAAGTSGHLLAGESEIPSKSANERLNVAVVGVKGRGGSHIGAFAGKPDTVITHIVDVDSVIGPQRAIEIGKRQGGMEPKWEEDIRKVLENPSIDIVTIATPNHWHSLMAIWAMQAGKDVYVEKPVSHHVTEGRRMVQAARKYNRICQGGTQYRSSGGNRAAAEYVRSGKLGQIKLAHVCTYRA